jgi:hypothetical protein
MLTETQKKMIKKNQMKARKLRLNSFDELNFTFVPDFIVDAFFGECTYHKRMIVSTFGYLNGIFVDKLIEMIHWIPCKSEQIKKVEALYRDFEKPKYRQKYYSFCVRRNAVYFLDGVLRHYGKRVLI